MILAYSPWVTSYFPRKNARVRDTGRGGCSPSVPTPSCDPISNLPALDEGENHPRRLTHGVAIRLGPLHGLSLVDLG